MSTLAHIEFEAGSQRFRADLGAAIDLAIRLDFDGPQPDAFYLEPASAEAVEADGFVGDTTRGGSANCRNLRLNPHGNGTHTECVGHIVDDQIAVGDIAPTGLLPATLLSVASTRFGECVESYGGTSASTDQVITRAALEKAWQSAGRPADFLDALILRTLPNSPAKRERSYSGTNPPYPTADAIQWSIDKGVEHLVVDLPSIDREDDGGALPNHHLFWEVPHGSHTLGEAARVQRTVTEMAFVPDTIDDGAYLLDLQMPRFALDAAPSRPLLYPVKFADEA